MRIIIIIIFIFIFFFITLFFWGLFGYLIIYVSIWLDTEKICRFHDKFWFPKRQKDKTFYTLNDWKLFSIQSGLLLCSPFS